MSFQPGDRVVIDTYDPLVNGLKGTVQGDGYYGDIRVKLDEAPEELVSLHAEFKQTDLYQSMIESGAGEDQWSDDPSVIFVAPYELLTAGVAA